MTQIFVCPLRLIVPTASASRAGAMLSLTGRDMVVERPETIAAMHHLRLAFSDIVAPQDGHILPQMQHVADMLAFIKIWDQKQPLLIHCWAGVSRSTAAAFIALCMLSPQRDEALIAQDLRRASPTATPNARLVALTDSFLERQGRMIAAIADIGRGCDCSEGVPFHLDVV